jgi:hypothetical protein
MNLPAPPAPDPADPVDPADAALERALHAWAAPALPDDGFTLAVLQRVARARTGLAPADALQRLRVQQQQQARQLRRSGWGLALGVALAMAWLLATTGWAEGSAGGAVPWLLWLGAALAGSAGAVAWLLQQAD